MKPTPFTNYSFDELKRSGRELVAGLRERKDKFDEKPWRTGRRVWTELVLNWFAAACARDLLCDTSLPPAEWDTDWARVAGGVEINTEARSSRKSVRSEFLQIDQVHSTYPLYETKYKSPKYWEDALEKEGALELRLALESEWKGNSDPRAYAETLHSVSKLAAIRARTKVLVFGSRRPRNSGDGLTSPDRLRADVARLRVRARDLDSAWLLIDLPWSRWDGDVAPRAWAVDAGAKAFAEVGDHGRAPNGAPGTENGEEPG